MTKIRMNIKSIFAASALAASIAITAPASAQEMAAYDIFKERNEESQTQISHEGLELFLERLGVEEKGRLKIGFSAAGENGSAYLKQYTRGLAAVSPAQLNSDEQLAYWLNMRNALILAAFSEKRGRGNLEDLRGNFQNPGALWAEKTVTVDGVALSIDDIERHIILAQWNDPRVIYGLYQGSESGPDLSKRPYSGENVWTRLETTGRAFVRSSAVKAKRSTLKLSAVYDWYNDALFGGDDAALRAHIASLASDRDQATIAKTTGIDFNRFRYRIEKFEPRNVAAPNTAGSGSYGGGSSSGSYGS